MRRTNLRRVQGRCRRHRSNQGDTQRVAKRASISGSLLTTEAVITEAPEQDEGGAGGGMPGGGGMGGIGGMGGMDYYAQTSEALREQRPSCVLAEFQTEQEAWIEEPIFGRTVVSHWRSSLRRRQCL